MSRTDSKTEGKDECPFCLKLQRLDSLPQEEIVWQFRDSVALLGPWQFYQGYCILVAKRHARELFELPVTVRRSFMDELCSLAEAIAKCFGPRKLNYELLGNQVPHLHWHLFPRSANDPDPMQPVWLALRQAETDAAERERLSSGPQSRSQIVGLLRKAIASQTPV